MCGAETLGLLILYSQVISPGPLNGGRKTNRKEWPRLLLNVKHDTEELWDTNEVGALSGLKLIHLNVRSLYPKIEAVREFVFVTKPDIFCIGETWLKPDLPTSLINIQNFSVVRNDRINKRGGGTCIYIHKRIKYSIVTDASHSDKDIELQTICLNGDQAHQKRMIVVLVYRPPSGVHANAINLLTELTARVDCFDKSEITIVGDLNWDYLNDNENGKRYIDEISEELQLQQLIKQPTRLSFHRDSLLDVLFSNIKNVYKVGVINYNLSDHLPIFMTKKREKIINEYQYIRKRSFRNFEVDTFSEALSDLDWSVLDLLSDVNVAWNMVYKGILLVVDEFCPYKDVKIKVKQPVWYNSKIRSRERERDILVRNYKRSKKKSEAGYQRVLQKRKEFNRILQSTKQNFFKEQIELFKGDSKSFWKLIDTLMGFKNDIIIDRVYYHGTTNLCPEEQTADVINDFFASVGSNVGHDASINSSEVNIGPYPKVELLGFEPISQSVFLDIIKDMKENKSSGIQDINSKLILDAMNSIPEIFVKIINMSLSTGKFPDEWKVARICVIPKKGDCKILDNLRPISLLSIMGKIIEKFVKKQLVDYFEQNGLFFDFQFGFRANRSIQDAIFLLTDEILRARNSNLYTCTGYLIYPKLSTV